MKARRLISALMVLLFVLTLFPVHGLPAYAEEAATAPVVVPATGSDETAEVTTVTVTATSEEGKSTEAVFVIAEDGGHAEVTVDEKISVTGESGEMASVGTLVVATGEDSAADVTVGTGINLNISATGNGGAEGINANAREGAEATVTVENGDIIAANNTGYATGVNATAIAGGDTTVAVTGDTVALTGSETAPGATLGVQAIALGEPGDGGTSDVTVTGNVEAISAGEGSSSGVHTEVENGSAAITVTENVSAYSQTGGNSYGASTENYDGQSSISVEGNIEARSNDGAAYGILAHTTSDDAAAAPASTTVEAAGAVSASAANAPAYGVYALDIAGGETTVTVGGAIEAKASEGTAVGVTAGSAGGSASTEVSVTDVTAEAVDLLGDPGAGNARGVMAGNQEGSTTSVKVEGDVTASAVVPDTEYFENGGAMGDAMGHEIIPSAASGSATGVYVRSEGEGYTDAAITGSVTAEGVLATAVGVAVVTGDPEVSAAGGNAEVSVAGDVKATNPESTDTDGINGIAKAIDAVIEEGNAAISVGGDVVADGDEAKAITLENMGGDATITVGGDVTATAEDGIAAGISFAGAQGTTEVSVEGDVQSTSEVASATAIEALNGKGSELTITVGGSVQQNTAEESSAIVANSYGDGSKLTIRIEGDVASVSGEKAETIETAAIQVTAYSTGEADISVGGDVTSDTNAITVDADNGTVNLTVAGDVKAEQTGLAVGGKNTDSSIDILVEGTISGAENAVMVDGVTADNMKLTVWKIDYTGENAVSSSGQSAEAAQAAAAVEESILYIIKLEQPKTGGTVSLDGTTESHGFDTAKEGETVTLKADAGYSIVGAYNGESAKVTLLQDENGDYYVVVPKGGGVYLTVETEKVPTEESSEASEPSYTFSFTDYAPTDTTEQTVVIYIPPVADNADTATAVVKGTAEDNSTVTAELNQVLKAGSVAQAAPEFAATAEAEDTITYGTVDFGGVFTDVQEAVIEVPVAVEGAVEGITYTVVFSDGTTAEVTCQENGVLVIPFPKDAENLGYAVQKNERAEFAQRYHRAIDLYTQFGTYADLSFLSYEELLQVMAFVDGD